MPPSLDSLLRGRTNADMLSTLSQTLRGLYPVEKTGLGSGGLVLSGSPLETQAVRVEITTAGTLSTAYLRYSFDAGATWVATNVLVPSNGQVPLTAQGVVLTFNPGSNPTTPPFQVGDAFDFEIHPPTFQVSAWSAFGTAQTLLEVVSVGLAIFSKLGRTITAGGFGRWADEDWIDLLAYELYDEVRREGTQAKHRVVLSDALGTGPHDIQPGRFWVASNSGLRFVSAEAGTLPKNGTLVLAVAAAEAGAQYNVSLSTIQRIVTTRAGVTVNNPDSGNGTSLLQQGTNRETREEFYQRFRQKWTTLSSIATDGLYIYWAKKASTEVTRLQALRSLTVPGKVDIYLAGPSGGVSAGAVTAVTAMLEAKTEALTNTFGVYAAPNHTINITATLECGQDYLGSVVAAAGLALDDYLRKVPLGDGGSTTEGGVVRDGPIIAALQKVPGMVDVTLTWAGDIVLARGEVAVPGLYTLTPALG